MSWIAVVILLLIVLVAGVLAVAARRPDRFLVERSTVIDAPPERIFPLLNDLRAHMQWSPFDRDPATRRSYSGPAAGPGAALDWQGNAQVGAGRLEIAEVTAPSRLGMVLDMYKPIRAHNQVEFTLTPEAGGTRVRWAMQGTRPLLIKVMGLFFDSDKMVGDQFAAGLASLKTLAEQPGAA